MNQELFSKIVHTKVCIVGAGPSGAATAIYLGKYEIEHIIIDAAQFPRDKTCGDGLDIKVIAALNNIDKSIIEHEIKPGGRINAGYGFRIITGKGKQVAFDYVAANNLPPYGTSKRFDFDNMLIERLNTRYSAFLQQTKAVSVTRINDKWEIIAQQSDGHIKIICDLLVGADGDHSIVLKTIGERKINKKDYGAGLRQYWKNVAGTHKNNLLEVYYPKGKAMSYFWIFPLSNGICNVGYGMQSSAAAKGSYNLKEIFEHIINHDENIRHRFANATALEPVKGWGLPLASLKRKCSGNGWLLVGDAASMISPTTGEGIGTGMTTGIIAAKFIQRAVQQNKFTEEMFKHYDREVYRRMKDDIRLYNMSLFISPKFMGWAMNNLLHFKFFQKLFQKKVRQWVNNAYNKELNVELD